jgi:murein DD-endopeptidase MepM/ murein hydrolase activator NlpD
LRRLLALLLGASAAFALASDRRTELPESVAQGAMVKGRTAPSAVVEVAGRRVRVDERGRFVFGVGRDQPGPVRVRVLWSDGAEETVNIAVQPRAWNIEDIRGVPEKTVNPPPEIAARIEREQAEVLKARERDDARADFDVDFRWPLTGRVSGVYGSQRIYNGAAKSPHSGLDVAAPKGAPLRAPAAGIVSFAKPDLYLTGGTVLIDHGHGVSSNFLHLSRIDVKPGDRVEQGQVIGLVGATGRATGPHMHWGMNWFDVRIDPQLLVDPAGNPQGQKPRQQ